MVQFKYSTLCALCFSCLLITSNHSILAQDYQDENLMITEERPNQSETQIIKDDSADRDEIVSIPDPALKAALNEQLGQSSYADISKGQLRSFNGILYLDHKGISDITGLQECVNLAGLDLSYNDVIDLGPLGSLTNLTNLYLEYNQIQDVSPLSNLTNLVELHLSHNNINNVSSLHPLVNLTMLHLADNQITELSGLDSLTKLTELTLAMNHIYSISNLSPLINLATLTLDQNQIEDISPLSSLVNLNALDLSKNQIKDISPLQSLTRLTVLYLDENQISNLSPLQYLISLTRLGLSMNSIQDISPLAGLTQLSELYLMNQKIKLSSVKVAPGENATLINPIHDLDTTYIDPLTISNNGYYEKTNHTINWLNILQSQNESFTFEHNVGVGNALTTFSGDVLVPLDFNGNSAPTLLIDDPLILELNQVFDPMDYVTAYDEEDGDISESIIIKENTIDITTLGVYLLTFEVTDSDGMTTSKTVTVHVTPRTAPRTGLGTMFIPLGIITLGAGVYLKRRQK